MIIHKAKNSAGKYVEVENTKQATFLRTNVAYSEEGCNYNGYGYADKMRYYKPMTISQMREFNKLGKIKPKAQKSEEEIKDAWCKRLSRLTDLSIDTCKQIADEKIDYHDDRIWDLKLADSRSGYPSKQRAKLINKLERENPLRYIQNASHAHAIIAASERHNNSNYEAKLDEGRELAKAGEIERSAVKEYARNNMQYYTTN